MSLDQESLNGIDIMFAVYKQVACTPAIFKITFLQKRVLNPLCMHIHYPQHGYASRSVYSSLLIVQGVCVIIAMLRNYLLPIIPYLKRGVT